MSRYMIIVFAAIGILLYLASDSDPSDESGAKNPGVLVAGMHQAMQSQLELAMISAYSSADCGYSDVGYAQYTPTQSAARLVSGMNAALMLVPGEPEPLGPTIDYVLSRPTKPWQVVVTADEENKVVRLAAYGTDLSTPLQEQQIPCS